MGWLWYNGGLVSDNLGNERIFVVAQPTMTEITVNVLTEVLQVAAKEALKYSPHARCANAILTEGTNTMAKRIAGGPRTLYGRQEQHT